MTTETATIHAAARAMGIPTKLMRNIPNGIPYSINADPDERYVVHDGGKPDEHQPFEVEDEEVGDE